MKVAVKTGNGYSIIKNINMKCNKNSTLVFKKVDFTEFRAIHRFNGRRWEMKLKLEVNS